MLRPANPWLYLLAPHRFLTLSLSERASGEFKADRGAAAEVVACAADETLGEVLQRAVDAKVHRVWVLADDGSPEGVVTFSDAIAKIA